MIKENKHGKIKLGSNNKQSIQTFICDALVQDLVEQEILYMLKIEKIRQGIK
jgi:hypothetical protein